MLRNFDGALGRTKTGNARRRIEETIGRADVVYTLCHKENAWLPGALRGNDDPFFPSPLQEWSRNRRLRLGRRCESMVRSVRAALGGERVREEGA